MEELKLHTIHTLPLKGFETATCTGELTVLVIAGEATAEDLLSCWRGLNSDWSEIVADSVARAQVSEGLRAYELAGRIVSITNLIEAMRTCYSARIKAALEGEGFDLEFDPADAEQYEADLHEVEMWLKADEIELAMLNSAEEPDDDTDEDSGAQKKQGRVAITPETFTEMLMEIYTHLIPGAPITDVEMLKEQMKTGTCAQYLQRLKKHYANPKPAMPHF